MVFPSQKYWSGLPFPPPGDLPELGIDPLSLLAGRFFTTGKQADSLPLNQVQGPFYFIELYTYMQ